jgi:hypothetical protein
MTGDGVNDILGLKRRRLLDRDGFGLLGGPQRGPHRQLG